VNRPTPAVAFIAPELALLPVLVAMMDASLALLHAQHPNLGGDGAPDDTHAARALRTARHLAYQIGRTRAALYRYGRAQRRVVREVTADDDNGQLNF
jgi:hypothetical protein